MKTQISAKFAALAVALMMNSLMLGGVAYLFNLQAHAQAPLHSMAAVAASVTTGKAV